MEVLQKIPPPLEGDENGYEAWLRYRLQPDKVLRKHYFNSVGSYSGDAPAVAIEELEYAVGAICEKAPTRQPDGGALRFSLNADLTELGEEGYHIRHNGSALEISAVRPAGLIYGTFALIRQLQLGSSLDGFAAKSSPQCPLRVLNHWDDPKFDHTIGPFNVTRGFAGNSIFYWKNLKAENPRYRDYARLLASIGINAVCLNNVNADPDVIETAFLPEIRAMADRLRPYNIKIFLSVPFTAPMVCDGEPADEEYGEGYPFCMRNRKIRLNTLDTADPLNPHVQRWWKNKADEIYSLIPDFGGFVIKANSEGMPGPQDYGRTHAEGANCLARALAPHEGLLFYRTFVYHGADKTASPQSPQYDGVCQPYLEFVPLNGKFDDNVILQTKCGPADFRAHEPPSPLLGAVPDTWQAIEFMVAQEYLGHTTHICFQGGYWKDILQFDTFQKGPGTTVASVVSKSKKENKSGAIVGVSNFGDDANWFGHLLAGANCYAFGRLAWDSTVDVNALIDEWITLTLGTNPHVLRVTRRILSDSYRLFSRYSVPLGLNYMHEANHHYEPRPSALNGNTWNSSGAGIDRTIESGTQFLSQYKAEARRHWENPRTTPVEQLLFFHHLPWDYEIEDGVDLATYTIRERTDAVEELREWLEDWRGLKNDLNPQMWAHVYERMQRQYVHAGKWRDAGIQALNQILQDKEPILNEKNSSILV